MIGPGAALFEADFVEGVFHRLAGDLDGSLERCIQLQRHFDCTRGREYAEERRQDCCRVMRRKQAEAQKEKAQPEEPAIPTTELRAQSCSARPIAIAPPVI